MCWRLFMQITWPCKSISPPFSSLSSTLPLSQFRLYCALYLLLGNGNGTAKSPKNGILLLLAIGFYVYVCVCVCVYLWAYVRVCVCVGQTSDFGKQFATHCQWSWTRWNISNFQLRKIYTIKKGKARRKSCNNNSSNNSIIIKASEKKSGIEKFT